jgi:cell division protein ZapA
MAQVNLTVNGRVYRMACEDGEEDHVMQLGERFDAAINELRGVLGEIGDQRLMVMAGILMTDRLGDTERRLERAEQEIQSLKDARADTAMRIEGLAQNFAESLNRAAARVEEMTERLLDRGGEAAASASEEPAAEEVAPAGAARRQGGAA